MRGLSGSCGCAEQEGRELIVGDVRDRGLGSMKYPRRQIRRG